MSELLDRAREVMAVCICHGDNDNPNIEISMSLVSELIEAVEFLEQAADHWKSLWRGAVEYSTKVIQERDDALRKLEQEQESHQETAEIMRRTRERAERLQAEIDAIKEKTSVSCCTLSYEEGFSQCLSCQRKLR
ncbi:hypothetical protein [Mycobacteroides abscessus]|uniref:hypothetical protein n=1 Tax=Mycobacteroides abscessus TaxID=36809 RepID=UPI0009298DF0|nr:hypothetical protein [Mycobacteroides abscessus]SIC59820.1 Uncharacterised protein [Mycobacteroides abscessus subsp. abscessus]SKU87913.1 Uncharacterised protein [Mycobacteroides abscessus subsp. massiliense]SKU95960.1 Uncharacterised protein [Mycobacteroides abscessus subsp. massiliense]